MADFSRKQHTDKKLGLLGPGADEVFISLVSPEIRRRVVLAHLVVRGRTTIQNRLTFPLGRHLLRRWLRNKAGSRFIEAKGLPSHIVQETLGEKALTLHVNPRQLIKMAEKRPSSLNFIWDGPWDQQLSDFRLSHYTHLFNELDKNRDHLERTLYFQKLMASIQRGKPWGSHQLGVLLDSPEKISDYLRIYLSYLDDMATNGFDQSRGKDPLGVAISREGRILKINRGLHRLAMAQHLALPSIPVRVQHVHRDWWNKVTEGSTGKEALHKARYALTSCTPETSDGALDTRPTPLAPDFWPKVEDYDDLSHPLQAEKHHFYSDS